MLVVRDEMTYLIGEVVAPAGKGVEAGVAGVGGRVAFVEVAGGDDA